MRIKSLTPSALNSIEYWLNRTTPDDSALVEDLMGTAESLPGDSMYVGEAWHSVVQAICSGEEVDTESPVYDEIEFDVRIDVALPRLVRCEVPVQYLMSVAGEPLLVRGRVDGIDAAGVPHELKTRRRAIGRDECVADRYWTNMQWKIYMLALGTDRVDYQVFQVGRRKKLDNGNIRIPIIGHWHDRFEWYTTIKDDVQEAVEVAVDVIDRKCPEYWSRNDGQ